jgi:hypothetical protein
MNRTYRSPDGVTWTVAVELPGSSNAMVVFRHPGGNSSRMDRYNWYISHGPEARSVTSRLSRQKVLESLDAAAIAALFRRSMPVSRNS